MRAEKKSEEAHAFNVGLRLPRSRSLGPKSRLRAERIFLSTYIYIYECAREWWPLSVRDTNRPHIKFPLFSNKTAVEIFLPCVGLEYHLLHLAEHAHLILYKSSQPATDKVSREDLRALQHNITSRAETRTPYCVCDQKANIM